MTTRALRVRNNDDDKVNASRLCVEMHHAELYVDDSSGVVLTTPTSATVIAATPLKCGKSSGCTMVAAEDAASTDGKITIARTGRYRIEFHCGEIVGVNNAADIVEAFVNDAVLAVAINAKFTQPSTALAIVSLAAGGYADLKVGDVVTFKATASTGNFTLKRGRFSVRQVDDGTTNPSVV